MEPVEEQVTYNVPVYRCYTSKGSMEDLLKALNRFHSRSNIVFIEPMIWKYGEVIEYGYRFIVKDTNDLPG